LPSRLRQKVGDDDIVQDLFRDLFIQACRRQFPGDTEPELWRVMTVRVAQRIRHEVRKFLAASRDVRRETAWPDSTANGCEDQAEPVEPHADQERSVTIHDQFVRFVNSLEWTEQLVMHLRLEHGTLEKVVDVLQGHWSLRKVQGIWEGICKKARERKEIDGWMDETIDRTGTMIRLAEVTD
jgi:hypothetical protein